MIRRIILILILMLMLSSCGAAAPAATQAPAATEAPATEAPIDEEPAATELPATEAPAPTEPPAFQSLEAPTRAVSSATPSPAATQSPVTPTDTALPTLDLPTEAVNAPEQMVWDGAPTYLAESTPGFAFRVKYDPELWALTTDQFGFPALAHRNIPGCVISVTSGRGLPLSMTVEHDVVNLENVTLDIGNVFENGALKFVTYTGGNQTIITGFQVDFQEQADECRAYAFAVISTLTAIRASQATPTPTP